MTRIEKMGGRIGRRTESRAGAPIASDFWMARSEWRCLRTGLMNHLEATALDSFSGLGREHVFAFVYISRAIFLAEFHFAPS